MYQAISKSKICEEIQSKKLKLFKSTLILFHQFFQSCYRDLLAALLALHSWGISPCARAINMKATWQARAASKLISVTTTYVATLDKPRKSFDTSVTAELTSVAFLETRYICLLLCQAFLDVFPALEDSGFAGNLRFLDI